jgi:hypothetical protein
MFEAIALFLLFRLGIIRVSFPLQPLTQKKGMTFMTVRFRPRSADLQHLQVGPLGPHIEGFATLVSQQGYSDVIGWLKVRLVARFSRWLQQHRIPVSEINEGRMADFLKARWTGVTHRTGVGHRATMTLLLRHLRQIKVLPAPPRAAAGSDIGLMALDYESFLLAERSLMPSSVARYVKKAHRFLDWRFPAGKIHLKKLRTQDVP